MQALTETLDTRVSRSTVQRVLREHRMRKWRAQKRIPLTKANAIDRYYFACYWIENIEDVLQEVTPDFTPEFANQPLDSLLR